MNQKIVIVGCGGFAREAFDIYIDLGKEDRVMGFTEENCKRQGEFLNGKPIFDVASLNSIRSKDNPLLIGAIGSTKRSQLLSKLEEEGYCFDTLIHPSVINSRWVKLGHGSIVAPGVIMTCQIQVGKHVIMNLGAHIGHDVIIGNFTTLSPGAEIMGSATLGNEVYVGTNATVLEHVKVGNGAIIAAGAVATKDVPEMALVAGVPGQVKKIYKTRDEKPW